MWRRKLTEHLTGKHCDDLTGEYTFGDAGQLIIFVLFLVAWITDSFFFRYSTFLNTHIPAAVHLALGAAFVILAGYLAFTGLNIVFNEVREKPQVIRKGIFGFVRHPIYLSEVLLYLGLLFFSTSLAAAAVWIIAIVFLHYISRYEEKVLLERFGNEYRQYMKKVPMWLPKLSRHK